MAASRSLGHYYAGNIIRMVATFVSTDYVTPADPSSVTFRLIYPDNSVTTYAYGVSSVARAGTGAYYADVTGSIYGDHYYEARGTGGVQAVDEWHFAIRHSHFVL